MSKKPLTPQQRKYLEVALQDVEMLIPLKSLSTLLTVMLTEAGVDPSWLAKEGHLYTKIVALGYPVCTIDPRDGSLNLVKLDDWMDQRIGEVS